jgi:hypothetical protein
MLLEDWLINEDNGVVVTGFRGQLYYHGDKKI